jgi:AraC-like DNA-binding protein
VLNFHLWKRLYQHYSSSKDTEERNVWLSAILIQLINISQRIPSDQQTIERLCMEISNDPRRNYTLEEMCELCGYSSNHLIRLFQKYKGISPHEFVTHVKMDKAKELLMRQLSVTQVAQYLNYYDANHFFKQFKKKMGVSPKTFVKQSFDQKNDPVV